MPVVIDDVLSVSAFCVDNVPHFQICAQLLLSILFVVVAEVRPDKETLFAVPPLHPVQVPVTVMLFTVVVAENDAFVPVRLPVTFTAPWKYPAQPEALEVLA